MKILIRMRYFNKSTVLLSLFLTVMVMHIFFSYTVVKFRRISDLIGNTTLISTKPCITRAPPMLERSLGWIESESHKTIHLESLNTYKNYLKITDIYDLLETANQHTSIVKLIRTKKYYNIGDEVRVNIILRDGWGRNLSMGGDMLRVWMRDPLQGANSSGYIIDHGDGTYTGVVKVLWQGKPEVKVSIANTRQHIGIVMDHIKQKGIFYYIQGQFKNKLTNKMTETNCSVVPQIRGYSEICNFTRNNFGMSWYCGKPRSKYISCEDWASYSGKQIHELTNVKGDLIKWHKHLVIPSAIYVAVNRGKKWRGTNIPCNKIPRERTWALETPTGYFFKGEWYPLQCKYTYRESKENYIKCFSGRPILFLGDSTNRHWFSYLTEMLDLNVTVGRWDEIRDKAWHNYAFSERKDLDISMAWAPHELPFYGADFASKENIRSVGSRLDEIGSGSSAIAVLHWYMHIMKGSPEIFREHVRNAKMAIQELLKRSPNVEILIKAPHAATYFEKVEPKDYIQRIQSQILAEEFKTFNNKVIYVDYWDMTVGSENVNVHPNKNMIGQMVHKLFSYVCFR